MEEMLIAAISFGFLGSLHCVGMCGGLVGAFAMSHQKSWRWGIGIYQLGRITTYAALGWIVAQVGIGLEYVGGDKWQTTAAFLVGLIMIAYGLNLAGIIPDPLARITGVIMKKLGLTKITRTLAHTQTQKQEPTRTVIVWLMMGLVNGLLPCGLVYAALSIALTSEVSIMGASVMALFGMGTIPAMTLAPTFMRRITPKLRGNLLRVFGILMILYGAFTSLRGSGLMHFIHSHQQKDQLQILKENCTVNEFHLNEKTK